jgi:hypothetical protein
MVKQEKEYIIVNTFSSTRKAAKYFNCSYPTITNYITTGKLFQRQWFLSYK